MNCPLCKKGSCEHTPAERHQALKEISAKLDAFWDNLFPEEKAALHTAFNMADKIEEFRKHPHILLATARSGKESISNINGNFLYFMGARIIRCGDAHSMMQAILDYSELSREQQVQKLHMPD